MSMACVILALNCESFLALVLVSRFQASACATALALKGPGLGLRLGLEGPGLGLKGPGISSKTRKQAIL